MNHNCTNSRGTIEGKVVLLTGGVGSIGRALIPRLLRHDPEAIRIFDKSESGLSKVCRTNDDDRCRYLLGDVRDKDRVRRAMENVDVVVHLAAIKHVDLSEYNPFETVRTNVLGLQNVIDAAIDADVSRFVFTSSDKAVMPSNTMGATKLLGEKLVTAGNQYSGSRDLQLTSIRFGNVVNSSESVVPLFREQISRGGPVTLTDNRMTRFLLTHDALCDIILEAMTRTQGGEVFIPKMPAVKISDLMDVMIAELAPKYGYNSDDIDVQLIGRRVGETMHEMLMTSREEERAVESDSAYAILPESSEQAGVFAHDGLYEYRSLSDPAPTSEDAPKISHDQIISILCQNEAMMVQQ